MGGYLPWTTGSMRPAGLVAVCNKIFTESGSGSSGAAAESTLVLLARLLRELNVGSLIALDHGLMNSSAILQP